MENQSLKTRMSFRANFLILCFIVLSLNSFAKEMLVSVACQEQVNVSVGPSGTASITPEDVTVIVGDVGDLDFITVSPNTFDCDDVGLVIPYVVTWSEGGVVNSCFGNILVEDKIGFSVACFGSVNVSLDADGVVELTEDIVLSSVSDNCPNYTVSVDPPFVSCADIGTPINANVTVTDAGGNTNNCFSTIIVEDKIPPSITCNSLINIALDFDGVVELTSDILLSSASDNCPLTFSISPASVSCADIGTPVVATITATDPGGNTSSCSTTLIVEDQQGPVAVCEANVILDLAGAPSVTIAPGDIDAGSFDNCGPLSFSLSQSTFTTADIGLNTVTLTVVDGGGNITTCFSTVEVINSVYCPAAGLSTNREFIRRVGFRGISNRSGDNGGYADFTGLVASVRPGRTHNLRLRPGFSGRSRRQFWTVWIDWNQNGVFEVSETVAAEVSRNNITTSIFVPPAAPAGTTRMRVMMKRGGFGDPCDIFPRGEVEDYTVMVQPSTSPMVSHPNLGSNGIAQPSLAAPVLEDDQINIYPNPAKTLLHLQSPQNLGDSQLVIYNLLGQKVKEQLQLIEEGQVLSLSLEGLPSGSYILVVHAAEGGTQTLPFIKN